MRPTPLVLLAFALGSPPGFLLASDREAAKSALVRTENAFFQHAQIHGFSSALNRYITEDGLVANRLTFGPEEPIEKTKSRSTRTLQRWHPICAEVAAAGDLGYTWGVAESAATAESTFKPYALYVMIWKRQRDGSWKFVYDAATILPAERLDTFLRERARMPLRPPPP